MRISRHMLWMEIAHVAAKRSTCYRGNTGAVVVLDRRILAIGYNGAPAGEAHCTGMTCERTPEGGCGRSLHAEVNALMRAGEAIGADLYVTTSPCDNCAKHIRLRGVRHVYYSTEYRDKEPIKWLWENKIPTHRLSPNGMIIDPLTNQLLTESS